MLETAIVLGACGEHSLRMAARGGRQRSASIAPVAYRVRASRSPDLRSRAGMGSGSDPFGLTPSHSSLRRGTLGTAPGLGRSFLSFGADKALRGAAVTRAGPSLSSSSPSSSSSSAPSLVFGLGSAGRYSKPSFFSPPPPTPRPPTLPPCPRLPDPHSSGRGLL